MGRVTSTILRGLSELQSSQVGSGGVESNSDQQVPLFNPRTDGWSDHFEWDDYSILGTTEVGKVTVAALDLNHARRIKIRQAEQLFGLFPPDD